MTKPYVKAAGPNLIELWNGFTYLLKPGDYARQEGDSLLIGDAISISNCSELLVADANQAIVEAVNWPQPMKLDVHVAVTGGEGS